MGLRSRFAVPAVAVDAFLAVGVLLLSLDSRVEISEDAARIFSRAPDEINLVLIVLMSLPVALRRIYPVSVFTVVVGAWMIDRILDYPNTLATIGVVLVFHSIGTELSARRSLTIGGGTAAFIVLFTAVGAATLESVAAVAVVTTFISTAAPLLLGREVHQRRQRMQDLETRAEAAERQREERTRLAVAEERARIARELHDVVAHQMTVVVLQADGARRIADGGDPRVLEALDTIRDAGHAAQTEMRRMVGLLRTPVDDQPGLAPLPSLADVPVLVDQVRAAEVPVRFEVTGTVRPLADGAELSVYRLIQESLTNAARHGGPDVSACVRIEYGDEHLDVWVEDDGRGAEVTASDGDGHGLVGMRERIAVLGGAFEAGPRPGGGFRVRATIPMEA